jgi:3-hydroxyacyl-CoA dehydrogenase
MDLAGIDIVAGVARNLQSAVPDDESRDALAAPPLLETLLAQGRLGNKTGQGFYKEVREGGARSYWVLDFETMEYRPPRPVDLPLIAAAREHPTLAERLRFLMQYADDHLGDRYAQLIAHDLLPPLAYAARRVPEIADSLTSVDRAMEWGYGHQAGPFATWNALGVAATVDRMRARAIAVAPWVEQMLAAGNTDFYIERDGRRWEWSPAAGDYTPLPDEPRVTDLAALKRAGREVAANRSASLVDLGDGVLLLEFHSKLNTIDNGTSAMTRQALEALRDSRWIGLVIGNQGTDFCVGANVLGILQAAQAEQWHRIDAMVRDFHQLQQSMRYSPKPVVTAPFGRVLGGGAEIAMYGARAVAAAETYIGLVEVGVGLIPGGGGCTEMVRRVVNPHMRAEHAQALPVVQRVFQTLGLAKVSASATDARALGLLRSTDRIIMNPDHLLSEAKQTVLDLVAAGYRPPAREKIYAAGRDTLAALRVAVHSMKTGGYATEYDAHIGNVLARILCGGELSAGQWVDEQVFLDLERETFVALCREPRTQQRIQTLLETGKAIRN